MPPTATETETEAPDETQGAPGAETTAETPSPPSDAIEESPVVDDPTRGQVQLSTGRIYEVIDIDDAAAKITSSEEWVTLMLDDGKPISVRRLSVVSFH
jgi:hypothetical protein